MKASITSQNEQLVIQSAEALDAKLLQAANTGLARALLMVVNVIQREWIQDGPRIKGELGPGARLHSITGRLRTGMESSSEIVGQTVLGQIGNSVKYAAFHEFGFHGTVNVRAHTRVTEQFTGKLDEETDTRRAIRSSSGEFLGFKESRKASTKFQKGGFVAVQFVKAHSRRVNYQGKPFVRPALEQNNVLILEEVKKDLAAVNN